MANDERSDDDLYSLDHPELRRKLETGEADNELIVPMDETSTAADDSNLEAPTPELLGSGYSTNVSVRTPSPPFILSDEQREFDDRMRRVHAERIADEKCAYDDRMRLLRADLDAAQARRDTASFFSSFSIFSSSELQMILQARRASVEKAEYKYALGEWYQLPSPWPMRQRMQLLRYPELLAQYYELEKKIATTLQTCSMWTRGQIESGQRMDAQTFRINDMLNEVEAARMKDEEEKGDEKVLGALLNNIQARLQNDIDNKFGAMPIATERVAVLAVPIQDAIARFPRLEDLLNDIRGLERSSFPERFPRLNLKRGRDSGDVKNGEVDIENPAYDGDDEENMPEVLEGVDPADFNSSDRWNWDTSQ